MSKLLKKVLCIRTARVGKTNLCWLPRSGTLLGLPARTDCVDGLKTK